MWIKETLRKMKCGARQRSCARDAGWQASQCLHDVRPYHCPFDALARL